ncbi:aminomethyltransferase family protein [Amphiplicatus metriothermophilus]|uniref:Aminomethyltransferase n=1 Tax=Amphiplicatus metriothermophilus TaxID=1519374 RepID=A0A239PT46_9PROT|nr:aminomethyltransferase family protein [Amphiplicatus metriothermophilus]MBB5519360.1 aminomethyltransferase [Amphiplicatus metriothermophilus]SNT73471.1 aminomethyltransferase [Amphiplicatus metriothermophilus]
MIFPADNPCTEDPSPTALFSAVASAARANSWTSVNGLATPRAYSNVAEEYEAAHASAVMADFGPIIRYTVRGSDAAALLSRVTSAPASGLIPGESARGLMLDAGGFVVDIVEATRLAEELFLLSTSLRHARRMQLAARGFEATVEEITQRVAALAILGPEARDAAAAAGLDAASETLARQKRVRGVETCARPVHFGALPGVEVIFPYEEALVLWERLRRARAPTPIGLDALEIIRIEGGTPRPGLDFINADAVSHGDDKRSPDEIGLVHLAPLDRAWFNGRRALAQAPRRRRMLAVVILDADETSPGAPVHGRKGPVGRITSWAWSPRLRRAAAFAELSAEAFARTEDLVVIGRGGGAPVAARLFETPESRLAQAFRASQRQATESAG